MGATCLSFRLLKLFQLSSKKQTPTRRHYEILFYRKGQTIWGPGWMDPTPEILTFRDGVTHRAA